MFLMELEKLKKILSKITFPFYFLNCLFERQRKVATVLKKELIIAFPCLGYMSNIIKTKLTAVVKNPQKLCMLNVLFKTISKLKPKTLVSETLSSNCIYRYTSKTCINSHREKTYRYMKVRNYKREYFDIDFQMLVCDHQGAWEDFRVFGRRSNNFFLKL